MLLLDWIDIEWFSLSWSFLIMGCKNIDIFFLLSLFYHELFFSFGFSYILVEVIKQLLFPAIEIDDSCWFYPKDCYIYWLSWFLDVIYFTFNAFSSLYCSFIFISYLSTSFCIVFSIYFFYTSTLSKSILDVRLFLFTLEIS